MIVTVTPNAALDITYRIDRLVPGTTHRVLDVSPRGGGKGVNVTSVLTAMGYPSLATGFAGGPPGQTLLADLTDRGIPHLFTDVVGSSRRNVKIHADDGVVTRFHEPGPPVPDAAWDQLHMSLEPLLAGPATALVVCGKMPPGAPRQAYADFVTWAHENDVPTIIDTAGADLLRAVARRPDVITPNRAELAEVTSGEGIVEGARELQKLGARTVVVTLGPKGLLVVPQEGPVLRAYLPVELKGDSNGSGDCVVAAVATGVGRDDWRTLACRSVAWSAASVHQPVKGLIEPADVPALQAQVVIEEVEGELDWS